MADKPKFFEDLAGVAGGAISALAGLREEVEAAVRARVDETIRKLDLVRRDELEAMTELAARARAGVDNAQKRIAMLEARIAALEAGRATPPPDEEYVGG
jgi:BMFP domain-containing protein YqiC